MYWAPNTNSSAWHPLNKVGMRVRNFCVFRHTQDRQWYISTKYHGLLEQHFGPYPTATAAQLAAEMLYEQGEI
jgi:hypothetical protein